MLRFGKLPLALITALSLVLLVAAVAGGAARERTVQILDNCDPASFNAALGDGSCVRDGGGVTFDRFVEQLLRKGRVDSWRFSPERLQLVAGGSIMAINRGGEFHTFTEVAAFGGGCVAEINALLGLDPVPECANAGMLFGTTGVAPGSSLQAGPLATGTHRFQCIIHPWQRTTVEAD